MRRFLISIIILVCGVNCISAQTLLDSIVEVKNFKIGFGNKTIIKDLSFTYHGRSVKEILNPYMPTSDLSLPRPLIIT